VGATSSDGGTDGGSGDLGKSGGMFTPSAECDGRGTCVTGVTMPCDPFICKDNMVCNSTCTTSADCSGSNPCTNGFCGPKPIGIACINGSECMSGFCVDGVCCDTACATKCMYCKLPGTALGHCTMVAAGDDPRGQCPVGTGGNALCSPGGCEGTAPKCVVAAAGTACAGVCISGLPTNYTCDAFGSCSISTPGTSCPLCKMCVVTGTSAGCANQLDGSLCMPPQCNGTNLNHATTCLAGACQAPVVESCLPYKCDVATNLCFKDCCNPIYGCCTCTGGPYSDATRCGSGTCAFTSGATTCGPSGSWWCCN
jgi:hypothetical protein